MLGGLCRFCGAPGVSVVYGEWLVRPLVAARVEYSLLERGVA